jgi:transposase
MYLNAPSGIVDWNDVYWWSQLVMSEFKKKGIPLPPEIRNLRFLTHNRMTSVSNLSLLKNNLLKFTISYGLKLENVVRDLNDNSVELILKNLLDGVTPVEAVRNVPGALELPEEDLRYALKSQIPHLTAKEIQVMLDRIELQRKILQDKEQLIIAAIAPIQEQINTLLTIPGINEIAAAQIIAEVGPTLATFQDSAHLCAWAGLSPRFKLLSGQRTSKTDKGNIWLKRTMIDCANVAILTNNVFREKYISLVVRMGHHRTVVAVAHKMLRAVFAVIKRNISTESREVKE